MSDYIEEKYLPRPFWGWVVLILFSAAILGFGMWLMMAIPDVQRQWNLGTYPDTPAESVYSTKQPPADITVFRVVPELPEASPLERIRTQGPTVGTQKNQREAQTLHGNQPQKPFPKEAGRK